MKKEYFFKYPLFLLIIFLSFYFCFQARAENIPNPAKDYTPNLWFDSQEQYYPANPLDFYFKNNTEISGKEAVEEYDSLSKQEKINNLTVFFHIQDNGDQWVYQYWFFYVFNDYQKSARNKHYGDWEAIYVYTNKNSGKIDKVIGTSHQRKIFDTEIYNPKTNHVWSYIGNGSHANCVSKQSDDNCYSLIWQKFEKFDKNGYKAKYNSYNLIEITPEFISQFNNSKTLNNSPVLGINIFDFLKIDNKEYYLPFGGNPPIYAWEQSSYYNPDEIRPINARYIAEYISNKANKAKNAVVNFFNNSLNYITNIFNKSESNNQPANIVSSLNLEKNKEENKEEDFKKEVKKEVFTLENASKEEQIIELNESNNLSNKESEKKPKELLIESKKENKDTTEEEKEEDKENNSLDVSSNNYSNPPLNFPFFIGGGSDELDHNPNPNTTATTSASTAATSTPDNISPSDIIDLAAIMGNNRGTIVLSWTSPGDDESIGTAAEYIIKYATSSINSLNWASSTGLTGEPIPNLASSSESMTINGLNVNQEYYFAVKTKDEADNFSNISNCASSSPQAKSDNIVISEVQIQGDSANDEFIELYNPTNKDVDLSSWSIQYRGSESNSFKKKNFVSSNSIPAQGYFLIANNDYNGHMIADMNHNSFKMSAVGGNVFLVNNQTELTDANDNSIIDKLSYGSGTYCFPETEIFTSVPGNNQSLERKNQSSSTADSLAVSGDEHWQGNNWDSNNNSNDFVLQAYSSPQNSLSLTEPRNNFAVLADTDWPIIQNNLNHTGLSPYSNNATGTPTSTPKWTASLGFNSASHLVIDANNYIYAGLNSGKVYKISSSGQTNLFFDSQEIYSIEYITIDSDNNFYLKDRHYLYKLNSTGELIWKYNCYGFSGPIIDSDGNIYIASDYYLYALTPNGEQIWQSQQLSNGRWIKSPIIDNNGNIYTVGKIGPCSSCQFVYKLDSLDGSVIWQTGSGSYYTSLSLDDQEILYLGGFSGDAGLYAIDSSNGIQKWHAYIGNIIESIPCINQNSINVGSYGNEMVYSIDKNNGNVDWSYYINAKISVSPITDNNGAIYIGGENNIFYALNSDGTPKWLAELNDKIINEPVIDSNGIIYIIANNGDIYAFGE